MAYFALIENGIVKNVTVVHNNELLVDGVEVESKGAEFCHKLLGGEWVQIKLPYKLQLSTYSLYPRQDSLSINYSTILKVNSKHQNGLK